MMRLQQVLEYVLKDLRYYLCMEKKEENRY